MSQLLVLIFLVFAYISIIYALPASPANVSTGNDTIVLPPGTSNHGNPRLICRPANWTDIAVFYLGNYVAHAATVVLEPGTSPLGATSSIVCAIFFPGPGLSRAVEAIITGSTFARIIKKNDIQAAASAGALCTVFHESKLPRGWKGSSNMISHGAQEPQQRTSLLVFFLLEHDLPSAFSPKIL
jgi:hypothetical protein